MADESKKPRVRVEVVEEDEAKENEKVEQKEEVVDDEEKSVEVDEKKEEKKESEEEKKESVDDDEKLEEENQKQKEETSTNTTKEEEKDEPSLSETNTKRGDKIPFWILFLAFLIGLSLGAGLVGGIFYYRSNVEEVFNNVEATPTPVSEVPAMDGKPVEEETTMDKALKKEVIKVSILNGSGIAGEAGKVKALLNDSGFTDITTGNAKTYDFTKTIVSTKADADKSLYSEIEKSLETYDVEKGEDLSKDSEFDVVVTVGKTKK